MSGESKDVSPIKVKGWTTHDKPVTLCPVGSGNLLVGVVIGGVRATVFTSDLLSAIESFYKREE